MRIFLFILLAAAIGLLSAIGFPEWTRFQDLRRQQATLEQIQQNASNVVKLRDELLERYNQLSTEDRRRLDAMLPESLQPEQIMQLLKDLTERHGMLLKQISVQEISSKNALIVKSVKPYQEAAFEISVSGTYRSFLEFLSSIEKNARLAEIESMSFSAGDVDSLEFALRGRARFIKQ